MRAVTQLVGRILAAESWSLQEYYLVVFTVTKYATGRCHCKFNFEVKNVCQSVSLSVCPSLSDLLSSVYLHVGLFCRLPVSLGPTVLQTLTGTVEMTTKLIEKCNVFEVSLICAASQGHASF